MPINISNLRTKVEETPFAIMTGVQQTSFDLLTLTQTNGVLQKLIEVQTGIADERWQCTFTARDLPKEGGRDYAGWTRFEAFFRKIQSRTSFFTVFDPNLQVPQGNPLVKLSDGERNQLMNGQQLNNKFKIEPLGSRPTIGESAKAGSTSVVLSGLLPRTMVLLPSDKFSIFYGVNKNIPLLHECAEQAYSDNQGRVRVEITPGLRNDVSAGDSITFYRPRSVFQVQEVESDRFAPNEANIFFGAIEFYEIINMPNVEV